MGHDYQSDIEAIDTIAAVPTILNVVCQVTGMGFSAVARVTEGRWVCLASNDQIGFGLTSGGELTVESTLCHEVRQAREAIVIDHVAESEAYCSHHTPRTYGFQSYISMPIFLNDGSFYGTLCAIDPKPRHLENPGVIGMFRLFADMIGTHLDIAKRLVVAEANLIDAQAATQLRDQFMAVLGHDLRNPIGSIMAGAMLLKKTRLDDKGLALAEMMENSATRAVALIENVMDLARTRLGGGLHITPVSQPLEPALLQVVNEMKTLHPGREIEMTFALQRSVSADHHRLARLVSNLLSNALAYSLADTPVKLSARSNGELVISVTNQGPAIPADTQKRLFVPFERGAERQDNQGLGLGLYIVSQIAEAHGGSIGATSTDQGTCFTFQMPLPPAPISVPEIAAPPASI